MSLDPELPEVLEDLRQAILGELHICMPGRVKTYDATKQVADVVPCIRGTIPDGDGNTIHEELPVIPNVPVSWPRGGGFYMHLPLAAGDHVWLIFNEKSIAQWRATGEVSDPGDLRHASLSYPFAVPGAAPDAKAFSDAPASGEAVFGVPGGGVFRVGGAGADFVALAGLVKARLDAIQTKFDTHTHIITMTAPAGAAGTAAPSAAPIGPLAPVAATKLKAE